MKEAFFSVVFKTIAVAIQFVSFSYYFSIYDSDNYIKLLNYFVYLGFLLSIDGSLVSSSRNYISKNLHKYETHKLLNTIQWIRVRSIYLFIPILIANYLFVENFLVYTIVSISISVVIFLIDHIFRALNFARSKSYRNHFQLSMFYWVPFLLVIMLTNFVNIEVVDIIFITSICVIFSGILHKNYFAPSISKLSNISYWIAAHENFKYFIQIQFLFLTLYGLDRLLITSYGSDQEILIYDLIFRCASMMVMGVAILNSLLWSRISENIENGLRLLKLYFCCFFVLIALVPIWLVSLMSELFQLFYGLELQKGFDGIIWLCYIFFSLQILGSIWTTKYNAFTKIKIQMQVSYLSLVIKIACIFFLMLFGMIDVLAYLLVSIIAVTIWPIYMVYKYVQVRF